MQARIPLRLTAAALAALLAIPTLPATVVLADSATHLQVTTTAANPQVAGVAFAITVTALDGADATDTSFVGTVTFSGGGAGETLPPDYTFLAGDNGTRTFTGVVLTAAGTRTINAADTVTSTIAGSAVVVVGPAPAATLAISGYPGSTSIGVPHVFTVTARDAYANVATTYAGTVAITSNDPLATLPTPDYTFVPGDNGTHLFSAAFGTAGTWSLTATDTATATITGTQAGIAVVKVSQSITFASPPTDVVVGGTGKAVSATATSNLPVTYSSTTPSVCTVNATSGVLALLTEGTCTIAADQSGNATYGAAPQVTQSLTVGAIIVPPPVGLPTLTVTADSKSRPFGQVNPELTATISGFVNGQSLATSGVSGSPACTTTATITSPAGAYPITCSLGTLASAAYTFAFAPGVLTVVRGVSSVTLSTATTVIETSTPVTYTATVEPSVTGAIPSGSLTFTIDGVARPAVELDAGGRGSVTVTWTTPGVKSVEVAYAGDGSAAAPGTASAAPLVVTNTARARGVGVLGSTFFPIVDRWRDTVIARGIRDERLALAIEVRNAQGKVVRRYAAGPSAGAYAWAWNGKTSRGVLAPSGRYTIRQTLIDPYGSRPQRTVTSNVTVSLRKIRWTTSIITVSRGPRCFQFSSGDGVGSYSCSSTAPLRLAGNAGDWPGVGYAFRLPAGGAYRSIRFEVQGTAIGRRPTIGFQDWTLGSAWGQLYRSGWARSAVSPTATRWAGVTKVDLAHFVSGRSVRVYVDGGGRLDGPLAFDIARARLVVSVGVFE